MKISYNWLKWYIPEIPDPKSLEDAFTFHICEVEEVIKLPDDTVFDVNILPNRAHDLLSHMGIAKELSSLLVLSYVDPTAKYKIPESKPTKLEIDIETDKCRRYMGRIVRGVKVGPSPEWVVKHLEAIGQRSINNIVDAANLVMYNCGQPIHAFDLDKLSSGKIIVRMAKEGQGMTTLDGKAVKFSKKDMVIADEKNILAIAGVKGGKIAEVDDSTRDIVLEVANFDPTSVRKTAQSLNIFTDAKKRFENDLPQSLGEYAMRELSALIAEMCPEASFEDIVDVYPIKQTERKLSFTSSDISKILGIKITDQTIEDILKRYGFEYSGNFEIVVPLMRLDLEIKEDMAEEIGRILGYDKLEPSIPKLPDEWKPSANETYEKMTSVRNKLLSDGYSEVMTYTFRDKGKVEVLASASDKKFLRTNLKDGMEESMRENKLNAPLLDMDEIKIFEIGTVFFKDKEEMHVAYGDKKGIQEMSLQAFSEVLGSPAPQAQPDHPQKPISSSFRIWSEYPFISRDIAVWVPEGEGPENLARLLKENGTDLLVKEPRLFDSFTKDGKTSYAFRLVFQSYERTLKDEEVNKIMEEITRKISANPGWQIR